MRRDNHIVKGEQLLVPFILIRIFGSKHVACISANLSVANRFVCRPGIHQASARNIDQECITFHGFEELRVHHVCRLHVQDAMQDHDICLLQ